MLASQRKRNKGLIWIHRFCFFSKIQYDCRTSAYSIYYTIFCSISSRPAGSMDRASAFGIVIPLDRSIAEGSGFESQVGRFFAFTSNFGNNETIIVTHDRETVEKLFVTVC